MSRLSLLRCSLAALLLCAGLQAGTLTEGFDDIAQLSVNGWSLVNNSTPLGTSSWFQGNPALMTSYSGNPSSYIGANYANGDFGGTISNWLITPILTIGSGDVFTFYTAGLLEGFADRLEVRYSSTGSSVGTTADSTGDFTNLLLSINPALTPDGYPGSWMQYSVSMASFAGTTGRIAFRYSTPGDLGNYIGIDDVRLGASAVPEPSTIGLAFFALAAGVYGIRRRANR